MKNVDKLEMLKKFRDESLELLSHSREEARVHRSYFRGDQLPDDVIDKLTSREQPLKWENIYKKLGSKILGLKILNRQEMDVIGRQTIDKSVANLLKNILRTSIDSTTYYSHKKRADKDLMLCGLSVMENIPRAIGKDELGSTQYEMIKRHISEESALIDPFSMEPDYSDAKYLTIVRDIDKEELYPFLDADKVDGLTLVNTQGNYRERVRVYYTWYKTYNKITKKQETRYAIWDDNEVLMDSNRNI